MEADGVSSPVGVNGRSVVCLVGFSQEGFHAASRRNSRVGFRSVTPLDIAELGNAKKNDSRSYET